MYKVVGTLAREVGNEELWTLFLSTGALHTNFYEGNLGDADVAAHVHRVARFVDAMEALLPAR